MFRLNRGLLLPLLSVAVVFSGCVAPSGTESEESGSESALASFFETGSGNEIKASLVDSDPQAPVVEAQISPEATNESEVANEEEVVVTEVFVEAKEEEVLPEPEPEIESVNLDPIPYEIQCTTDTFKQRADDELLEKTDILFVMDNSGSMRDDWQRVANNIKILVEKIPANVHVRYAVLLGHVAEFEGELYAAPGEPKVLDNKVLSTDEIGNSLFKTFNSAMDLDDPGTGEAAFRSLQKSVQKKFKANQNLGFFRNDAALSIVFMSDENEIGFGMPEISRADNLPRQCDAFWEARIKKIFYDDCDHDVKSLVDALKGAKRDYPIRAHAFVNITLEDLFTNNSPEAECLYDSLGYGYFDVVEEFGGTLYSLQADRVAGMEQVGEAVRRSLKRIHNFKLKSYYRNVDPATVVAKVDGQVVEHKLNQKWNVVNLPYAGEALSDIEITYCELPPAPPEPKEEPAPAPAPAPAPSPEPTPAPSPEPAPAPSPEPSPEPTPEPEEPYVPEIPDCMKDYAKPCEFANLGSWTVVGLDGTTTSTTARIIWQTEGVLTVGILQVGTSEEELLRSEAKPFRQYTSSASQHVHEYTVDNLIPNTRYFFRVIAMDKKGRTIYSNIISKKTKE